MHKSGIAFIAKRAAKVCRNVWGGIFIHNWPPYSANFFWTVLWQIGLFPVIFTNTVGISSSHPFRYLDSCSPHSRVKRTIRDFLRFPFVIRIDRSDRLMSSFFMADNSLIRLPVVYKISTTTR